MDTLTVNPLLTKQLNTLMLKITILEQVKAQTDKRLGVGFDFSK